MAEENSELAPDQDTDLPPPPAHNFTSTSADVISADAVGAPSSVAELLLIFESLVPPSLMAMTGHTNLQITGAVVVSSDAVDTPLLVAVLPLHNIAESLSVAVLSLIFESAAPPSLMEKLGHNNLRVTGGSVVSG